MIIQVSLEHTRRQGWKRKAQIVDVDAAEIASISQAQGQKGVRGLVSEIISKRLPPQFSDFEVVGWELVDNA